MQTNTENDQGGATDSDDDEMHMPGHLGHSHLPRSTPNPGPGEMPTFRRGAGMFRVGFAGRGMYRGRGQ